MNISDLDQKIIHKMQAAEVAAATIQSFLKAVHKVMEGDRGLLPESEVEPVPDLPRLESSAHPVGDGAELLRRLAVIKLNGGLGTSMGLDRAKSLIRVKGEDNFLDYIARQILGLRRRTRMSEPGFYLMNSFTTRAETLAYLQEYSDLAPGGCVDFLQNKVPKLDLRLFEPVSWPADPELEWCPPGHGDIYPALLDSGLLEQLLERGVKYLFVSNSDNLGATVDLELLDYFSRSGLSFLMEVAERTAADRKGGHLARRRITGRFLLRESAQTPPEDEGAFQDIARHRFFNTNNLWIRLEDLREELNRQGGAMPLPLITNVKTVDPRDGNAPKVLQIESAMGAAIECFEKAGAMVVPRTRFAPVKTTSDLLLLRSDAYEVTEDHRMVLQASRRGRPPLVELDARHYKVLESFERMFPDGPPSLLECNFLKVTGPVRFAAGVICRGKVEVQNRAAETRLLAPGVYENTRVEL